MTLTSVTFRNGRIFDGTRLLEGHALRCDDGRVSAIGPEGKLSDGTEVRDLDGDILSPGYVDLQVNGGDGVMLNDDPSVETLRRISRAHRRLGVQLLLPTLITDTPKKTQATIDAAIRAIAEGVPGIAGLHLEGPHLSIARKGAHDAELIRPMGEADLAALLDAAAALPILKVTIAPENVTEAQVTALTRAGILVSLGHSDADFETCLRYFAAGARCATHLFNAMSQLGSRAPGLVGAVLETPDASTGLIADAFHVHPATIRAAWDAKRGPGRIFLVSDAMALAGTNGTEFTLGGRRVRRENGILTLADGTLAGADLDLTQAVRVMIEHVGLNPATALHAATTGPATMIGQQDACQLRIGTKLADMIRISGDFSGTIPLE